MSYSEKFRVGRRKSNYLTALLVGSAILIQVGESVAGVLVAPTIVFLSDKNRTGRMTIQNPTNTPKEVFVNFSFGLPTSDSMGNITLTLQDSGVTDPRSALGWVKAFPRKVLIPANGSQVVRVAANPPANLPDGEYWAQIVVRSQEGELTVPAANEADKITTKLNMVMQTAIRLKYRTGKLVSELNLNRAYAHLVKSRVQVTIDLTNNGNVSYVGMLKCRLLDLEKNEISSTAIDLAVYRNLKRRLELPVGEKQVPYKVEISIGNEGRNDIPPEEMINGNKIEYSMKVE
jgi:hypothetical protein